eukprot:2345747-Pleurochrysis_carterae.AAC.2
MVPVGMMMKRALHGGDITVNPTNVCTYWRAATTYLARAARHDKLGQCRQHSTRSTRLIAGLPRPAGRLLSAHGRLAY